jgi:cephalosporin hydroxylase
LRGSSIASDCKVKDIEKIANDNMNNFNVNKYDCKILKGNSRSTKIYDQVCEEFPNGIDLLFIDGDHTRKGVTSDFEMYFPLVNAGGYIVFDDYLPFRYNNKDRQCPRAINDLVKKYENNLQVIGLIDDLVECNKIRNRKQDKNISFIVIKNHL